MFYRIIPNIFQHLFWIPVRFILHLFYGYTVRGKENLRGVDFSHGVIFASNHAAKIDPVVFVAALSPFSSFYPIFSVTMMPTEYQKHGAIRHLMKPLVASVYGGYPVEKGLANYDKALRHHIHILADSGSIFIFPEGRMTRDGVLSEPRPGVGFLAERSGAVVIPVGIKGTYEHRLFKGVSRKQPFSITFGKPLNPSDLLEDAPIHKPERYYYVAGKIMEGITEALQS